MTDTSSHAIAPAVVPSIADVTPQAAHAAGLRLGKAFQRIAQTRMAGLPFLNPTLHVEAVGFRPWGARILGVLIAPWTMNLVVLAGNDRDFRTLGADARQSWTFPSGEYEFMGGEDVECGPFHFCSLFSPMDDFADQRTARQTAEAVLDALFNTAMSDIGDVPSDVPPEAAPEPVSRRGFLFGEHRA